MKTKFFLLGLLLGLIIGFLLGYYYCRFWHKKPQYPVSTHMISESQASCYTTAFRDPNVSTIKVPLAWAFHSAVLQEMISHSNNGYVRFYAGLDSCANTQAGFKHTMTLIAVPAFEIFENGLSHPGNDFIGPVGVGGIFDFADHCPTKCSENNILMPPPGRDYPLTSMPVFNRQTP